MSEGKRPIIIIDGLNCFIRFMLVNESLNAYSEPIGGIVGFMRFIDMLINRFSPGKLIVIWENGGASSRRKHISSTYKADRTKIKDFDKKKGASIKDLLRYDTETKIKQLSLLYQLLKSTPICQIFVKDTECDDIIGYLIKYKFKNEERTKYVVSSDKDFYQLLEDFSVRIYDPGIRSTIDSKFVLDKYKISPKNFCIAKTLNGDKSDNIIGVPGVGFKTIAKRFPSVLSQVKDVTIDDLLEDCKKKTEDGSHLKTFQSILDCEKLIRLNWKLMYLTSSNLSASQIEKIEGTLEQHEPKMDKLDLIKKISKAGLNMSFDFNRFSTELKRCLIFD